MPLRKRKRPLPKSGGHSVDSDQGSSTRKTATPNKFTEAASNHGHANARVGENPTFDKIWATVDENFRFKVTAWTSPQHATKKRKRGAAAAESSYKTAPSPWEGGQEVCYSVSPSNKWLKAYIFRTLNKKQEDGWKKYRPNDHIEAEYAIEEDGETKTRVGSAKVLEIRGGDEKHVFLLVFWLYRPNDLKERELRAAPYHGHNELIASNHLDIINYTQVIRKIDVTDWDNESEGLGSDKLFWRQTLDVYNPGGAKLSEISKHCIDKQPCNPDSPLIKCPNSKCGVRLHDACLLQDAIARACDRHGIRYSVLDTTLAGKEGNATELEKSDNKKTLISSSATKRGRGKIVEVTANLSDPSSFFSAKLVLATLSDEKGEKIKSDGKTTIAKVNAARSSQSRIIISDLRPGHEGESEEEDIKCLSCKETIT